MKIFSLIIILCMYGCRKQVENNSVQEESQQIENEPTQEEPQKVNDLQDNDVDIIIEENEDLIEEELSGEEVEKADNECHDFILNQVSSFTTNPATELTNDELKLVSNCSYKNKKSKLRSCLIFSFKTIENGLVIRFKIGIAFNYDENLNLITTVVYKK